MANAIYKVQYEGLKKRDTYDEIVSYLSHNNDKIKYPNRFFKQMRESPQLSNLLDNQGMGLVEMNEKEMSKIQHEQAEQAVIQTASSSGSSANVLRATTPKIKPIQTREFFTQTKNPKMAEAGTQAWRPNKASVGSQSAEPSKLSAETQTGAQTFDMTLDDKIDDLSANIQMEIDAEAESNKRKKKNMLSLTDGQFGEPVLPPNIVEAMINNIERGYIRPSFAPSSSNQPMSMEVDPETYVEPKGPVGRPRKTQSNPMTVDTDQKRKTDEESPNKSRAKPKSKTDKETEKKPSGYIKSGDISNNEPERTTPQPASSSIFLF
jgi:hypothetical protein